MVFFKKILFPVDLSEASKKMVPYLKEVVDKFGAELHVVRAANIGQYYVAAYAGDAVPTIIEEEENSLTEFVKAHFKSIPVQSKILLGPPGPEIIEYARKNEMDLIIMGHSSTGIARAVFGSVAGYVVKNSPVPVLIISPGILENKLEVMTQKKVV
jgi:nucleotide-binding universal stress UspA family protein